VRPWTVFLHPAQRETVDRAYSGRARASGTAGTGKTIVALHRAGHTFSLEGTRPCDVCARSTCQSHIRRCDWCGARTCEQNMSGTRCATSGRLETATDMPDDVIAAVVRVSGDVPPKERRIARDGTRFVVHLDLGWTRRLVITVPYGSAASTRVVRHSLLGSSELP
jgi:hypothetical protein